MHLKRKKAIEILNRLAALLEKKPGKLDEEDVHHIRTSTRKAETLLETLPPKQAKRSRLEPKLKKLRKRAGAVRDADVQIGLLHGLPLHSAAPKASEQKQHLVKALHLQRVLGKKRLDKFLAGNSGEIREELLTLRDDLPKQTNGQLSKVDGNEALHEATHRFRTLVSAHPVLNPSNLHDFRKRCKHIRYLAEMGNETPESQHFVQQLTAIQDAIGTWHDWQTLHALAFQLGMHHDLMAVIEMLENMERHKYTEAIRVAADATKSTAVLHKKFVARKKPPAKTVSTASHEEPESVPA